MLIEQDHYYRAQPERPLEERERINYDHPDALEMDLLVRHLDELRAGRPVIRPTYDFAVHDRAPEGVSIGNTTRPCGRCTSRSSSPASALRT